MKKTFTLTTFAFAVGSNDRQTQEASQPFHLEYIKGDKAFQARMRTDWIVNYVSGNLGIAQAKAIKVVETSRTERTEEQQQSCDRARAQFKYHVQRPEPKQSVNTHKDVVAKLVQEFKALTTAQQRRFFNAVK